MISINQSQFGIQRSNAQTFKGNKEKILQEVIDKIDVIREYKKGNIDIAKEKALLYSIEQLKKDKSTPFAGFKALWNAIFKK